MAAMDSCIRTSYLKSLSSHRFDIVWWEAMKCVLPLRADFDGPLGDEDESQAGDLAGEPREHECLFSEYDEDRIKLIATEMDMGKTVSLKMPKYWHAAKGVSAKAKAAGGKKSGKTVKPDKADKRGTDNGTDKKDAVTEIVQDKALLKNLQFLDDFSWCVDQASNALAANGYIVDIELRHEVACAARKSMHLLWRQRVVYNCTTHKLWTSLKKAIVKNIACAAAAFLIAKEKEQQDAQEIHSDDDSHCKEIDLLAMRAFVNDLTTVGGKSQKVTMLPAYCSGIDIVRAEIQRLQDIDDTPIRRLCDLVEPLVSI